MSHTFAALDAEWRSMSASPASIRALRRWALCEPDLAFRTFDELMTGRRENVDAGRAILGALARLAHSDRLAARALLQALIPGIKSLARAFARGNPDVDADLVALAWERIRTYPTHRPGSVAANVLFDVRKRYCAGLRKDQRERELTMPATEPLSPEELVVERDGSYLRHLVDARDQGLISQCALRVIVRTRIEGDSLEDMAREEDLTVRNLVLRRWRGERALRRHLDPLALAG